MPDAPATATDPEAAIHQSIELHPAASSRSIEIHTPSEAPIAPTEEEFNWTASLILQSITLFVIAAAFEVGGGWLIWETVRVKKPWWWALLGSLVLVCYGFVPTFQPISNFGRIFAVYGGFFIVYSYAWGWALDGQKPDTGDFTGAGIAIFGVCVCWFWPRKVRVD